MSDKKICEGNTFPPIQNTVNKLIDEKMNTAQTEVYESIDINKDLAINLKSYKMSKKTEKIIADELYKKFVKNAQGLALLQQKSK